MRVAPLIQSLPDFHSVEHGCTYFLNHDELGQINVQTLLEIMNVLRLLMQLIENLLYLVYLGKFLVEWVNDFEHLLPENLLGEVADLVHQLGDLHHLSSGSSWRSTA
jgi:hypothetical protein